MNAAPSIEILITPVHKSMKQMKSVSLLMRGVFFPEVVSSLLGFNFICFRKTRSVIHKSFLGVGEVFASELCLCLTSWHHSLGHLFSRNPRQVEGINEGLNK